MTKMNLRRGENKPKRVGPASGAGPLGMTRGGAYAACFSDSRRLPRSIRMLLPGLINCATVRGFTRYAFAPARMPS